MLDLAQVSMEDSGSAREWTIERLQDAVDTAGLVLWELDPATLGCTFVSNGIERLSGYSAALWLSHPQFWLSRIHAADRQTLFDACAAAARHAAKQNVVLRLLTADERLLWISVMLHVVVDEAGCCRLRGTMCDISSLPGILQSEMEALRHNHGLLDEAEALRRSDRFKSEFIAHISHELRTPLHHIKGYASTLLRSHEQCDPATLRDYLQIIIEETDQLERLVVDILDTSRIERQALTLDIDSVRLDELVRKVLQRWALTSHHHFELIMPSDMPPIPADPYRIEQVLNNLLSNVVRYTPERTLTTISLQTSRSEVQLSVRDRGPGVAPEHLPHLFERFYRAHTATRSGERGSGLGLFICKEIIEQHGGTIWAANMPDGGMLFCFRLPRRRSAALQQQVPTPGACAERAPVE